MSAVSVSESGVRPVLADAAEVARRALVALEPDGVGVHLGVTAEDDTAATHRFEATLPGYRGWQWAVVVAAPPGADHATVSESALLPAIDALIAPDFIPWDQRVRPGDLGPGDLLAAPADDPRLVPGYIATGDPVIDEVAREVGLGRVQVLSVEGRADAAQRWFTEFGPDTEMAKAAPSTCGMCGFYLPLAGALRESFGVCGNAMGADGHVVHIEYGCGAHSDVVAPSGNGSPLYEAFDDHAVDFVEIVRPAVENAIDKVVSEATADATATVDESADATATVVAADDATATVDEAADATATVVAADDATATLDEIAAAPVAGDESATDAPTLVDEAAADAPVVVDEAADVADDVHPATVVVEVVAEATTDPAIEVVEVAVETAAATPAPEAAEPADSLTEVGVAAAQQAGDRQETAEAEAVAAVDAERAALAEGALPESAEEVVNAEIASDTEVSAEAGLNADEVAAVAGGEGAAVSGAEGDAVASGGAESGEAAESADLSEHGSSVSR
ncbi:DUF3027 domain-containing protein [Nocardia sp. NPDC058705]|uniref:DUF3027 domain-containing protein n=1 Tax=Nocardia sp. NPDC058705 TaxID=3346609 RepID=UPI003699722A